MSSEPMSIAFERQLQKVKLLWTLTSEAKEKLVLNERYLRHLRDLQEEGVNTSSNACHEDIVLNERYLRHLRDLLEEGVKTSVDLKVCHEERSSAAVDALEELTQSLDGVDRNTEAMNKFRERVAALRLKTNLPSVTGSTAATPSEQCLITQPSAIDVGAGPKRVQSSSPALGGRVGRVAQEVYPKRFTRNSIIKHFDLPRKREEFFGAFRSDLPPERLVELHRRLETIPEDDDEDEKTSASASSSHCPLM